MAPSAPQSSRISIEATGFEAVVPMSHAPDLELPAVSGYTILRELGRGAMGVVYEAIDNALHRPVALKLITEECAASAAASARFGDEAEAVARLRHPNVVQIYGVGEHRGRPFLALELVRGGSLAELLKEGPLDPPDAIDILRTIARAVHHAHENGVIHRDLKPGNVLLVRDEGGRMKDESKTGSDSAAPSSFILHPSSLSPKVSDFGLAKLTDSDRRRTRSGMFLGTLGYVAPEQIDTPNAASASSDVYSLGVMLFECLTGSLPIVGDSFLNTLNRILEEEPQPPSAFRPGLPAALDAVCRRALAKQPASRYPSAAALADDLDRIAAGRRVRRPIPWRPAARAALILAVVSGCASGLFLAVRHHDGATAVRNVEELIARGEFAEAETAAARGLGRVRGVPGAASLTEQLTRTSRAARRGRLAGELHRVIDRLRFGYEPESVSAEGRRELGRTCDQLWGARDQLLAADAPLPQAVELQLRGDVLDLALLSAELLGGEDAAARLREAEQLFGSTPVLIRIRDAYQSGQPLPESPEGLTAWESHAVGRYHLNRGDSEAAALFLRAAVDREPDAFWPNFHLALAALRCGRPEEALVGFTACLTVAQDRRALCHYNRAVAYEALKKSDAALKDLDRALDLEPGLARAAFRRGVIRYERGEWADAARDLDRALRAGHPPAATWYHLALVRRAAGDVAAALSCATEAVRHDPTDARAAKLLNELSPAPPKGN